MDVGAELVQVDALVGDADLVEQARDGVGIAQRNGEHEQDDRFLHALRQPADEAEVEQADPVPLDDDDVAGVRIAVEEPVGEELVEARVEDVPGELLLVHAARVLQDFLELAALQFLERDHGLARQLAVQLRNHHVRPLRVVPGELLDVARFVLEIELEQHRAAEFGDDAGRRVDAGLLDHALEKPRQVEEEVGVGADLLLDNRPLHLDDDVLAALQPRAVDLRDRSRRHRFRIDPREQLVRGLAEALVDQLQHRLQRHRRGAIL